MDYLTNTSAEGADTGAAAVDTGAAVAGTGADVTTQVKPTDLQKFVTFVKGFSNKDDLTNEELLALGNSEYSVSQLATALGIEVSDLTTAITACQTCLLYTSPSPRDRTRSRMPSSA